MPKLFSTWANVIFAVANRRIGSCPACAGNHQNMRNMRKRRVPIIRQAPYICDYHVESSMLTLSLFLSLLPLKRHRILLEDPHHEPAPSVSNPTSLLRP